MARFYVVDTQACQRAAEGTDFDSRPGSEPVPFLDCLKKSLVVVQF